jgi:hypothetical protein
LVIGTAQFCGGLLLQRFLLRTKEVAVLEPTTSRAYGACASSFRLGLLLVGSSFGSSGIRLSGVSSRSYVVLVCFPLVCVKLFPRQDLFVDLSGKHPPLPLSRLFCPHHMSYLSALPTLRPRGPLVRIGSSPTSRSTCARAQGSNEESWSSAGPDSH